jgi:hypothetical protein
MLGVSYLRFLLYFYNFLPTKCLLFFFFFFLLDFGLSRLTSLQFIQYHVAGFYKPTIPQSPPSHLRDYSTCNNARLEFSTIFVTSLDPNEWCLKNCLHSGGLNPGPLGHESSALTTRPRLLANLLFIYPTLSVCILYVDHSCTYFLSCSLYFGRCIIQSYKITHLK